MICEQAYYPNETGEDRAKLLCRDPDVIDGVFKGKCPFVYWCHVDGKYENTADMFECVFREKKDDR